MSGLVPSTRGKVGDAGPIDAEIASLRDQWSQSFERKLLSRARDKSLQKKDRTKFKFLAGTSRLLQERGSGPITVDSIVDFVGLARGTFYIYFDSASDIIRSLLVSFSEDVNTTHRFNRFFSRPAQITHAANLFQCRVYQQNQGLYAARALHTDEVLSDLYERVNADWARAILKSSRLALNPLQQVDSQRLLGLIRLLISMSDDAMRERFVRQDALMSRTFENADCLAEGLTHIWCLTLYGKPPLSEDFEQVKTHRLFAG